MAAVPTPEQLQQLIAQMAALHAELAGCGEQMAPHGADGGERRQSAAAEVLPAHVTLLVIWPEAPASKATHNTLRRRTASAIMT